LLETINVEPDPSQASTAVGNDGHGQNFVRNQKITRGRKTNPRKAREGKRVRSETALGTNMPGLLYMQML